MKYKKEINWLRSKGYTGNRFRSDSYDDFSIGVFAKRLHEYAKEVNGDSTSQDKSLSLEDISQQRKLLLDFAEWMEYNSAHKTPEQCVNIFIKT